jgi:hypothetical protein
MRKFALLSLVAAFGLGTGTIALAQERAPGKSGETPGHEMQEHGSVPGSPGASGYAPGHTKDTDDIRRGATTGSSARDRDDTRFKGDHDRDDVKVKRDRD